MTTANIETLKDVASVEVSPDRLPSATHEEILNGLTTDIYFIRTRDLLSHMNLLDTPVVAEVFARKNGIFAGLDEVKTLLKGKNVVIDALPEGTHFKPKDTLMRLTGPYGAFGMYETTLLGMLAASTGWATAARECVEAAEGKPVLCFGARHVHPAVAPVMERIAVKVGGCAGASCILGAKLLGLNPSGTIPHAAILMAGDTLKLAKVYDEFTPAGETRVVLIDTFKDESEEAIRVAEALGDHLGAVRLDTPSERGGVSPELIREVRYRLDMAGFKHVKIVATGGLTPERIRVLAEAGADTFGVGSYICHGQKIDMTLDLKVVNGKPVAKRGRLPGPLDNPLLVRV
ncbi:MAG: nicotinate phosphoribosyltransferase [Pyramidobacter sp.]|nr:nicotinate phosphoribosyltransferase [Pyramidobacter sp.]